MVDPNEADIYGFGPQIGSPVFHLPDGRRLAISVFDIFIFKGIGTMAYEYNMGASLWKIVGSPYAIWQSTTPDPAVAPEQVLSNIIVANGGPASFILNTMNYASKQIADYLKFNPQWEVNENLANEVVNAMSSWELKPVIPSVPGLIVLPRFK